LKEKIIIPKNYEVEDCVYIQTSLDTVHTYDKEKRRNGSLVPLVNTLIPGTKPVELVYLTYCDAGSVKGPHMHLPPKYDRFICIKGECGVVIRNEQTKKIEEWRMRKDDMLLIPPYNSHAIVSKEGCCVLSICNEGYYPGHYNQIETEYKGYDWNQWL